MENRIVFKSFEEKWNLQTNGLVGPGGTSCNTYHIEAAELRMFLDVNRKYHCLELGCGNGDLHPHLCDIYDSYTGVDFSASSIQVFKAKYPTARLIVGNALDFSTDRQFDLIHSNHLVQFLTTEEVHVLQKKLLPMCVPGGLIIHRGFLDKKLLGLYFRGYLYPGIHRLKLNRMFHPFFYRVIQLINYITGTHNLLGIWHTRDEILAVHDKLGIQANIFNSPAHHNRFNIVVKK